MLWYDVRRSLLSFKMIAIVTVGLLILYQPTLYVYLEEGRWIWENDLLNAVRDAFGLGYYIMCSTATAAVCASALFLKDKKSGMVSYLLPRIGTARYILSKFLCCGLSGAVSLSVPFLAYAFIQYSAFCGWVCEPGAWELIWVDVGLFASYGFVWAIVGLSISSWGTNLQMAIASPFGIAFTLKMFCNYTDFKWLDPGLQIATLNGPTHPIQWILVGQCVCVLACLSIFVAGVKRCIK